jgi:GT2 family glycosyltransferase
MTILNLNHHIWGSMFSVILNSYNPTRAHLHMTMECLAEITKYTDDPYEIIVVDNKPDDMEKPLDIRDDYKVLHPYTYILNETNQTVYHSYNQGVSVAQYDKLVFIQSDVFCHERTINKLVKYLDEFDVAFPQQVPVSREDVKKIHETSDGTATDIGGRDAGMMAITREAFDKVGGWDDRFHNLLGEAAFYTKCADAHLSWTDRTNALITHIMAGNNLTKEEGLYNAEMDHDSKLLEEYK